MMLEINRLTIELIVNPTGKFQLQTGCQNNDIGVQLCARFQLDASLVETLNMVGDNLCPPFSYGGE
jgi:hypothetical protein